MFTALAQPDIDMQSSVIKFIALSPCVMFNTKFKGAEAWKSEPYFETGLYKFPSAGIHAFKGPNWEEDLKKICSEEFRPEVCNEFTKLTEQSIPISNQPTSILNLIYWWNNGFQKRF